MAMNLFLLRPDGYGRYRDQREIKDHRFMYGDRPDYEPLGEQTTVRIPKDRDRATIIWMALCLHFSPSQRSDIIGLLCYLPDYRDKANPNYLTRSLGIDIDNHKDDNHDAINNFYFAITVFKRLRKLGYHPILTDSNHRGGFHIEVAFDGLIECWKSRAIGIAVTHDWATYGFASPVEVFPKSIGETEKGIGGWLRMVGHHHKCPHWSMVWDMDNPGWLDGYPAVDFLLHHTKMSTYRDDPLILEYWDRLMVKPSRVSQNGNGQASKPSNGVVTQLTLSKSRLRDLERATSALKYCENLTNPEIFHVAAALRGKFGLDGRKVFLDWLGACGPNAHWRNSSNNYTLGYFARQFDERATSDNYTVGTVYHYAAQRGWVKPWMSYARSY